MSSGLLLFVVIVEEKDATSQPAIASDDPNNILRTLMNLFPGIRLLRADSFDEEIAALLQAEGLAEGKPCHLNCLTDLANAYGGRYKSREIKDVEDNENSLRYAQRASDLIQAMSSAHVSDLTKTRLECTLVEGFIHRYNYTESHENLDKALDHIKAAFDAVSERKPVSFPQQEMVLQATKKLAYKLEECYNISHVQMDLDNNIAIRQLATSMMRFVQREIILSIEQASHCRYIELAFDCSAELSFHLFTRYTHTDDPEDLIQSLQIMRESLAILPPGQARETQFEVVWRLAQRVYGQFEDRCQQGQLPNCTEVAIELHLLAIKLAPANGEEQIHCREKLASIYHRRSGVALLHKLPGDSLTKEVDDLKEALRLCLEIINLAQNIDEDPPFQSIASLASAAHMFRNIHELAGGFQNLDNAVQHMQRALKLAVRAGMAAQNFALVPKLRIELAELLIERFHTYTHQDSDLDESIFEARQAVEVGNGDPRTQANRLFVLAYALLHRSGHTARSDDLDKSLDLMYQAMHMMPPSDDPVQREKTLDLLVKLHDGLLHRFMRSWDKRDIDEAIEQARKAVKSGGTATLADSMIFPLLLSRLSWALSYRCRWYPARLDAEEALKHARQCVLLGPGNGESYSALSSALRQMYVFSQDPAELQEAVIAARQAITSIPEGERTLQKALQRYSFELEDVLKEAAEAAGSEATNLAIETERIENLLRAWELHDSNPFDRLKAAKKV